MITNKIINEIKDALNELLILFTNKKISEEELLKTISESAYYNIQYKSYFYEMLFITALENNNIPRNANIIGALFNFIDTESFLLPESYNQDGTRMNILKKLKLKKSIELYELFLIKQDEEAHTYFKEGIKNIKYKKAQDLNVTFEMVKDSIDKELK